MALLRIGEGEDESEHGDAGGLQCLGGLLQVLLLGDALAGDQHDAVGETAEHDAVVRDGHRGGVDDHVVVLGERLPDQRFHRVGVEQDAGVRRALAGGQDVQVRLPVALDHVLRGHLTGEHMGQTRMPFDTQMVGDGRVAQVGVDEQHLSTVLGQCGGHVHGGRGLAFGRGDRADDDHLALTGDAVGLQERDVGADTAVLLGDRAARLGDDDRLLLQQDLIVRDAADRRGSEDASDIGGRVDTGVEHLTNNCEADTQDDTDDQAGRKIERHVRRARSLRQGGLLHDGQ